MQIYIDESGNLGKKGRFFVISALMPEKPKRIKNIIKRCCVRFGRANNILDEIKGYNLNFSQKQEILEKLNKKDDFHCSYIVADKNHISSRLLEDKNICYNYLASHLFKLILRGANEDVQVILDNHSIKVKSINSLQDYIKLEAYTKWGFGHKITFEYQDSKSHKNLQAIDLIVNVIYGHYTYNKQHLYSLIDTKFIHRIRFPHSKFNT